MKLRIKGNSLRLRVSRTEVKRLLETGRIEETIQFAPENDAKLTYALEHSISEKDICLRYREQEVTVVLSTEEARRWAEGDGVGVHGKQSIGHIELALLVEKDFACLHGSEADNEDAFPNPSHNAKGR